MRGKLGRALGMAGFGRITPADAGKTSAASIFTALFWDHPRGCGENNATFATVLGGSGSPPRMRGKRAIIAQRILYSGITPADAGKTAKIKILCCSHRDHPRGCGENLSQR